MPDRDTPADLSPAEIEARRKHRLRQRQGHKMPDWEGLSEWMQQELIQREEKQIQKPLVGLLIALAAILQLTACTNTITDRMDEFFSGRPAPQEEPVVKPTITPR